MDRNPDAIYTHSLQFPNGRKSPTTTTKTLNFRKILTINTKSN